MVNGKQSSENDSHPIELHNREVTDMFGDAPNWLIHSGSYILYGVLILFLTGTALISYPDIVRGTVIIDDFANVEWITATSNGQIETFFVENDLFVRQGDTICILQNTARLDDVNKLCEFLNNVKHEFQTNNIDSLKAFPAGLKMGEMSDVYDNLTKAIKNYLIYDGNNYYSQRKNFLQKQYNIMNRDFEKNELALIKLEQDMFELSVLHQTEIRKNREQLELAYEDMMNGLRTWESKYLIRSGSEGRIFLGEMHTLSRPVLHGDTIGSVISNNKEEYIGLIEMDQEHVAGVTVGNPVYIRLVMYPEHTYGKLIGNVSSINFIPYNKQYMVDVEFPDQLYTTAKKVIKYELGLKGEAEIITSNRSVLLRIFNPILSLFREHAGG